MDTEERQHLEAVLHVHRKNLRHLELQAAGHGTWALDISLHNAIENEKAQIVDLERRLQHTDEVSSVLPSLFFRFKPIALLYILAGDRAGMAYFVTEDQRVLTFGRARGTGQYLGCDVILPSPSLSKAHYQLTITPIEITDTNQHGYTVEIRDVGSSNGTFLNGKRLVPHHDCVLHDRDTIRCGGLHLLFCQLPL